MLREELARDWRMVEEHLHNATSADPAQGLPLASFVALSLDHAYQAFETLLVRLERSLGLPERSGKDWHRALLADATLPLAELRPAICPREVELDWEALLKFRHFLRHAYAVALDPDKLRANVQRLSRAVAATAPLVRALVEALRARSLSE